MAKVPSPKGNSDASTARKVADVTAKGGMSKTSQAGSSIPGEPDYNTATRNRPKAIDQKAAGKGDYHGDSRNK